MTFIINLGIFFVFFYFIKDTKGTLYGSKGHALPGPNFENNVLYELNDFIPKYESHNNLTHDCSFYKQNMNNHNVSSGNYDNNVYLYEIDLNNEFTQYYEINYDTIYVNNSKIIHIVAPIGWIIIKTQNQTVEFYLKDQLNEIMIYKNQIHLEKYSFYYHLKEIYVSKIFYNYIKNGHYIVGHNQDKYIITLLDENRNPTYFKANNNIIKKTNIYTTNTDPVVIKDLTVESNNYYNFIYMCEKCTIVENICYLDKINDKYKCLKQRHYYVNKEIGQTYDCLNYNNKHQHNIKYVLTSGTLYALEIENDYKFCFSDSFENFVSQICKESDIIKNTLFNVNNTNDYDNQTELKGTQDFEEIQIDLYKEISGGSFKWLYIVIGLFITILCFVVVGIPIYIYIYKRRFKKVQNRLYNPLNVNL